MRDLNPKKENSADNFSMRNALDLMRGLTASDFASVNTTAKKKKNPNPTLLQMLHEDISGVNNQEYQEDQEAILQAVNAPCSITNYVDDGAKINIRGVIKFSSEVNFLFTTENIDGCYIWTSTKGLQLDEDILQSIMKLRAYFDSWYQSSLQKLNH